MLTSALFIVQTIQIKDSVKITQGINQN